MNKDIARNAILLIFSLFFYTWGEPKALPVMLLIILVNFYLALHLKKHEKSKYLFVTGIIINLTILCVFKYLDFVIHNLNQILPYLNLPKISEPHIMLPIGISFYIFQALSYLIDVYRGNIPPQKSLFRFSLYISLFPQLIAGPIVRYMQIEPDLENRQSDISNIQSGLIRFCIGLAKKIFIADSLGYVADCIFNSPVHTIPCLWAWTGALTYSLQIYYDFSAYSDMAIGIGKIFNFHFPENFNYPYAAKTIQEFWRRWHMSLTQWLKDYLYIPLGGSRCSLTKTYRNILIVLLCCGIWHGAAWTFIFWGFYNGLGLIIERICVNAIPDKVKNNKIFICLHWGITVLFILAGWVIFRCNTLPEATQYLTIMFSGNPEFSVFSLATVWENCLTISNGIFLLCGLVFSQPIKGFTFEKIDNSIPWQILLLIVFIATYSFILTSNYSPFLYFRF